MNELKKFEASLEVKKWLKVELFEKEITKSEGTFILYKLKLENLIEFIIFKFNSNTINAELNQSLENILSVSYNFFLNKRNYFNLILEILSKFIVII